MQYVQELQQKAAQTARLSVELEQARQQIDVLQKVMCVAAFVKSKVQQQMGAATKYNTTLLSFSKTTFLTENKEASVVEAED